MKLILVFLLLILIGCSHNQSKTTHSENRQVLLQFRPQAGQTEVMSHCFVTSTQTFVKNELRNKRIEATDFKTKQVTIKNTPTILQDLTTFYKDGLQPLNDLALPELNQTIDFEILPNGKVLKAGNYNKSSIFYIPSLPLPEKPVKVGESWQVENSWNEDKTKMLIKSQITSTLKSIQTCGSSECAEITFKGKMVLPEKFQKQILFEHQLNGRFLFDLQQGLVPYALFESDELMRDHETQAVVKSRLRSHLLQPQGYYIIDHAEQVCPSSTMEE